MYLRLFIGVVIAWFAMDAAIVYGGIWDSKAHPKANVEVQFDGGRRVTGTLSRNWDKSWSLVQSNGAEVNFTDYQVMTFDLPKSNAVAISHWRSMSPVAVVSFVFLGFLLWALKILPGRRYEKHHTNE